MPQKELIYKKSSHNDIEMEMYNSYVSEKRKATKERGNKYECNKTLQQQMCNKFDVY